MSDDDSTDDEITLSQIPTLYDLPDIPYRHFTEDGKSHMRRIPKDNLPGILWFMGQAKWDRGQEFRNRNTFIELGLMAAHLTGGDTAPKGPT